MINRLWPLLLLLVIGLGVWRWSAWRSTQLRSEQQRNALVFAQVWLLSARYHAFPDSFLLAREHLLQEAGTDTASLQAFRLRLEKHPTAALRFSEEVSRLVDSLQLAKAK